MKFHDLDYAGHRRVPRWAAALAAVALLALAAGGWQYGRTAARFNALHAQADKLRAALLLAEPQPQPAAPPPSPERVHAINDAIAALNTPWQPLLHALESTRPADAILMQVESHPQDQALLVTAQAQDVATLFDFMAGLSHTPPFVEVRPVRQEVLTDGSGRKQATFEARWEAAP